MKLTKYSSKKLFWVGPGHDGNSIYLYLSSGVSDLQTLCVYPHDTPLIARGRHLNVEDNFAALPVRFEFYPYTSFDP